MAFHQLPYGMRTQLQRASNSRIQTIEDSKTTAFYKRILDTQKRCLYSKQYGIGCNTCVPYTCLSNIQNTSNTTPIVLSNSEIITEIGADPILFYDPNASGSIVGTSVNDQSSTNNDGTLQNGTTTITDGTNTVFSFDGTNDYISTTTSYVDPSNVSVIVWFKTSTSRDGKIVGFENLQTGTTSSQWDRHLYLGGTNDSLNFGIYDGDTDVATNTSVNVIDGNWHFAAGTYSEDNSEVKLYVDGVTNVDTATSSFAQDYTGYWRIGSYKLDTWPNSSSSGYFTGRVGYVQVYHVSLTSDQIKVIYDNTRTRFL
jgi:hypothetical protein